MKFNEKLAAKWAAIPGVTFPQKKKPAPLPSSYLSREQLQFMREHAEYAPAPPPGYISTAAAEKILGISRGSAAKLFRKGRIQGKYFFRPTGQSRVLAILLLRDSVNAYMQNRPQTIAADEN